MAAVLPQLQHRPSPVLELGATVALQRHRGSASRCHGRPMTIYDQIQSMTKYIGQVRLENESIKE
jgi:hypothetical protein